MELTAVIVVGGLFLGYSLVSGKLSGTVLTAPLLFVAFGLLLGPAGLSVVHIDVEHSLIHLVAELTLILVLFADASRIDIERVRRDHNLPVRMLVVGLPGAIVFGTILATWVFPSFSFLEAALLAALLAPTDAALGQSVVTAKSVPIRIRQAINIESGLNDGIALPVVLLLAALAAGVSDATEGAGYWLQFALLQITLGPLAGAIAGYLGAKALDAAADRGWATTAFQGVGILSLSVLTYAIAEKIGGNGFIAAFVAGMVFGNSLRHPCTYLFEFMESEGSLLMLATFLIFGAALLPEGLVSFEISHLVYAVLSLTVIRVVPIALSLLGTGIRLPTYLFLGWFGPRGLASILFVLLILEESHISHGDAILSVTVLTVALSVLLHGVTAAPLAAAYGRLAGTMGECEETATVSVVQLRSGTADNNNEGAQA